MEMVKNLMQGLQDKFIYNVIFIMNNVKELIKNSDYEIIYLGPSSFFKSLENMFSKGNVN